MREVTMTRYTRLNIRNNIADINVLHDALRASMKGSAWKREPQAFAHNWLAELSKLKKELQTQTYKTMQGSEFTLNERGKIRHIHGGRMRDRIVRHALCDEIITPCMLPYLIHNNGASQSGKGLSFARREFERDLHNYWLKHKSNKGYIAFVDLSKFYDNIQHGKVKELLFPVIPQDHHWLIDEILHNMEVDVSYMTDSEYESCLDCKFDSVAYYAANHPKSVTRERRRLKAHKRLLDKDVLTFNDVELAYKSWMGEYTKIMSKIQIKHMKSLFRSLFGKEIRWKRGLDSRMVRKLSQRKTEVASS